MKSNSTMIWLVAGVLCFGLGFAGGRNLKNSASSEQEVANSRQRPLGSALSPSAPEFSLGDVDSPALARRLRLLERLATIDLDQLPDLARELMGERPEPYDYTDLLPLMDRWIELDPAGGFEFFASAFGAERSEIYGTQIFAGRWARVDPDAALRAALDCGSEDLSDNCHSIIGDALASERPKDFFRLYEDLTEGGENSVSVGQAAYWLSLTDPQAVIDFLPQLSALAREGVSGDIAYGWAKKNPDAALAWARGLGEGETRARAFRAIASQLIETDPQRAAEAYLEGGKSARERPFGGSNFVRNEYFGQLYGWGAMAKKLADIDPIAAFRWAGYSGNRNASNTRQTRRPLPRGHLRIRDREVEHTRSGQPERHRWAGCAPAAR